MLLVEEAGGHGNNFFEIVGAVPDLFVVELSSR